MQLLVAIIFDHFFIGIGLCLLFVTLFWKYNRRRPNHFFRFGGDSPVSIGNKSRWLTWYLFSLTFEIATSFIVPALYREFALSIFEAVVMTFGLFITDRIAMMFEPEEYWNLAYKQGATKVSNEAVTPEAITNEKPQETIPQPKSWIKKKEERVAEGIKETAGEIKETMNDASSASRGWFNGGMRVFQNVRENRRKRKEEKKLQREAERQQALDKFKDLTRNN